MCGIRTHILGASRGLQRVTFLKLVYCLDRMIIFGKTPLRRVIHNFVIHYHTERNHQSLESRLISAEPRPFTTTGIIERRQRLGGLLNYCYRAAA